MPQAFAFHVIANCILWNGARLPGLCTQAVQLSRNRILVVGGCGETIVPWQEQVILIDLSGARPTWGYVELKVGMRPRGEEGLLSVNQNILMRSFWLRSARTSPLPPC